MRMDVSPLRDSRDFRLLFVAGTVFYFGSMVSYVAIPFQVYRLTGSNFAVGAIGLVELVPLIFFGLYGGALADHVDRRRLLIGCGIAQAVLTGILGVNAFLAAASSMQRPSREALMPRTVRHDQITAANALTGFGMQLGVLVGPAVGGLLIAFVGIGWCFLPPPRGDHRAELGGHQAGHRLRAAPP
jgi:MFS family permease